MSDTHQTIDRCYLHLERFSLLYRYYAIVDTPDYYADQLFIRHQVTVRFGNEYAHPDAQYRVIFCMVRKQDEQRFLDALQELPNKMLLCGHPDYPTFCTQFFQKMEQSKAKQSDAPERTTMKAKIVLPSAQTKKRRRAANAAKRGSWNGVNPVTRIVPDRKAYDRKRDKRADRQLSEYAF